MSFESTALPGRQVSSARLRQKSSSKSYVIAMAAATLCGTAMADGPEFRFSGFGTLGATYTKERNADYVSTIFQANGVGHTASTSFAPDTKLGGQMNAVFSDKFSAVVQLVAQHQYDNSYRPEIEWANLKYQITPELSVRAGRGPLPIFMISDTRFVGYANPWIRVPIEIYGLYPVTSNDGIDISHRSRIGSANNTVQAYYGVSDAHLTIPNSKIKSRPAWGINDTVEIGSLSIRASYNTVNLQIESPLLEEVTGMLPANIAPKYALKDIDLSTLSIGATFDPGQWFVTGEFTNFNGDKLIGGGRGWYVTGGYRIGKFTPYATYSSGKDNSELETGAGPFNDMINSIVAEPTQKSTSIGLRWDFRKDMSLKGQFDRIELGSTSTGYFKSVQPDFLPGSKVNLFSVALDFVF